MKINLGFLKDAMEARRMRETDDQPQAHYSVPLPPHAKPDLMISFFDKETMLPRRVKWATSSGMLRCSMPPMKRVELRMAWIEDDQLEGVRYVLGPASKFRTHVGDTSVGDHDLL